MLPTICIPLLCFIGLLPFSDCDRLLYDKRWEQSRSVVALGKCNPILNLLLLLFPLGIVHNLPEKLLDDHLSGQRSLFLGELLGILEISLIIAQIETSDDIIQGIFWFWGQDQSIDAVHDLSEVQGRAVVAIEDGMADPTLRVHVAVVNRSDESHLGSFEGIAAWELRV